MLAKQWGNTFPKGLNSKKIHATSAPSRCAGELLSLVKWPLIFVSGYKSRIAKGFMILFSCEREDLAEEMAVLKSGIKWLLCLLLGPGFYACLKSK
ncbi:MAG: hypothetical protein HC842_00400 [Cytophagales bacterium]|nr:hypothetical protein [Cytophagales bacterium]